VVGPDGKGVAGLTIEAEPVYPGELTGISLVFALPRCRTEPNGHFRLHSVAEGRNLLRFEPPAVFAAKDPPVVESGTEDLSIVLARGEEVKIRVLDPDGKPATGATVRASVPGHSWMAREAKADGAGNARLTGLGLQTPYDLTVVPPAGRWDIAGIRSFGWKPVADTLTLPRGETVEGRILGQSGPVPKAVVWWKDSRGIWQSATASSNGGFRITALAGSRVTLCASEPASRHRLKAGPEVIVDAGAKGLSLKLAERE
jgi:hypothetical protein